MKITIDDINKTVKVDTPIKVGELTKKLKSMFPDDWEEYQILQGETHIYNPYPITPYPWNPQEPLVPNDYIWYDSTGTPHFGEYTKSTGAATNTLDLINVN